MTGRGHPFRRPRGTQGRPAGGAAGIAGTARRVRHSHGIYARYDESTATRLDDNAALLLECWKGDLRVLRDEAEGDVSRITEALREFDGIGPAGANIFVREMQQVWPGVRPFADDLVLKGAAAAGLPRNADDLAALVDPDDMARLAAALVRVARTPSLLDEA